MGTPRYGWWGYAKYLVREYPALRREYEELKTPCITSDPSKATGAASSTLSRSVENIAMRQLPPARQADYDAVTKAIEQTRRLKTGEERLRLIDMVFWKESHTLEGAAYKIGYSYDRAKTFHSDFLRLVGFNRGLEDLQ